MKRIFCTYFDHRYLPRGLALISSLREHGSQDEVWVLCLSAECYRALTAMALPGVRCLTCADLEAAYPALLDAKRGRSTIEYYFTCTPQIMRYVFDRDANAQMVTYLDTDLYFFDRVELVFDEIGDASVAITAHNYPGRLRHLEKFGVYNVSWVSFRRTEEGLNCLHWWAERCIEWCFDKPCADGRFADQGYLNEFPRIAPNLHVFRHPGINLAPWNVANFRITCKEGHISADGAPLIFFHFHGVKRGLRWFYFNIHRVYGAPLGWGLRNCAYRPYVAALLKWERVADAQLAGEIASQKSLARGSGARLTDKLKSAARDLQRFVYRLLDLVCGRAILAIGRSVY